MTKYNYLSGFLNYHETEAISGTLPIGQNSPQKVTNGLYAELISGSSFTTARAENRRTWVYRTLPSVKHSSFEKSFHQSFLTAPYDKVELCSPNQYRWNPPKLASKETNFLEGIKTLLLSGGWQAQTGLSVHLYTCNKSMENACFSNFDGEMLILPQAGTLTITTEMGVLEVEPLELVVIPRGVKFSVNVSENCLGYIAENYGAQLTLPELGPIGSNGPALSRDFLAPVAAFKDEKKQFELHVKAQGHFWKSECDHNPFNVIAWHGTLYPYKYDLRRYNPIGSISKDHPDPSIFTVLTAPGGRPGVANLDFVAFAPRWLVQEETFRPPWYHRNYMSEYMGLICGEYDAKIDKGGFVPGGGSLHNCFSAHGPDAAAFDLASTMKLEPQKLDNTMAFMFETFNSYQLAPFALEKGFLQDDYQKCWEGLKNNFSK